MNSFLKKLLVLALFFGALSVNVLADPPPADKAKEAVEKFLAEHKVDTKGYWSEGLKELTDPALEKTYPKHRFFLLRFRQYPVARAVPPPLQANNIFAVDGGLNVRLSVTTDGLLEFFKVAAPKSRVTFLDTCVAWAVLGKELIDDGMFHLEVARDKIECQETAQPTHMVCRVPVHPKPGGGNSGVVEFTLRLDGEYEPETLRISGKVENKLQAGPRPICQSMRLNHPDAAVREQAERELLTMGRAALPYLRWRMEIVNDALREKIQGLIDRIEAAPAEP